MTQVLSNQWIHKRRPHWDRLTSLLAQCDASGLGQLSRAELQEMALLYRQVAADNGMMLGVIGAACHHYDMSLALWSFVAPHGALELPSILIAGGAGFRLGHAMLFPGAPRWKESVARGGIEATQLVSGIIPLLVIAGTLEGFFSPSQAPVWLKFTVGGLLFTLLLVWLFWPVKATAQQA